MLLINQDFSTYMREEQAMWNERNLMVQYQIKNRGISDPLVLAAMLAVPRHLFVPPDLVHLAYEDRPLPIGFDQTISQPYIVAQMTALLKLKEGDTVLEIGTGSGYQAAVLAAMGVNVISIERKPEVMEIAKENLKRAGIFKINLIISDGTTGYEPGAPYQGIIVTASAPSIPKSLIDQLDDNGRLVIPVGDRYIQELLLIKKEGGNLYKTMYGAVRFVPLIGEEGWKDK